MLFDNVREASNPPQNYEAMYAALPAIESALDERIQERQNIHGKEYRSSSYFGDLIFARREQLGISQVELARDLGIGGSSEFIGLVERGARRLEPNKVPIIADLLGLDREDMIRIWLFELAPILAMSLFGVKAAAFKEPGKTTPQKVHGFKRTPDTEKYQQKLYSLPSAQRTLVLNMIDTFAKAVKPANLKKLKAKSDKMQHREREQANG